MSEPLTIDLEVAIAEMAADAATGFITLDPALVQSILDGTGDKSPKFPVLRIVEGVSGNGFEWTPEVMEDTARQINTQKPPAYMGHIKPEDDRWVFPEIQAQWLAAKTTTENGKKVMYVKGYLLPDSKARSYHAAGINLTTSWSGKAAIQHMKGGIKRVKKFALESIDFARPGKAAMSAELIAVVAEMSERSEQVETNEIAKLTIADLTAANPSLVELIKREARSEADTRISEMEGEVEQAKDAKSLVQRLRELLELPDTGDVIQTVTNLITRVESIGREGILGEVRKVLADKVKGDTDEAKASRALIERLVPIAEMQDAFDGKPKEEVESGVKAKMDTIFNEDAGVKKIVADFDNAGGSSRRPLTHIAEQRDGNADYSAGKSTGNVRVSKVKL